ncbi:B12-binding domain-containing radical SAM protein [bacterium]|nr:B12-binding domain-containing radical SAM protein [candidate division CSSED10-310 bacterium]
MTQKSSLSKTVLLINPQHHRNWKFKESIYSFPIGLMYLGTVLKQSGYHPVIIDTCVDPDYESKIQKYLPGSIYAGVSAMTPQVPHAMELASLIRNIAPETPIVWGGIHVSLYPESCLDPLCDVSVIGEGDRTCVDLAHALETGGNLELVKGIAFAENNRVIKTPTPELLDASTLPFIDYDLVDPESYITAYVIQEHRMARVIPIHAARGCPWHCTFCINTTLNEQRRYRPRPAKALADEIEALRNRFRIEGFIIQDEEFFADRDRILRFLNEIENRGMTDLKYYATSRVNHFRPGYIDRKFLERLKRCGFVDLVFGFESGSRHCLEIIQKEITVDQGLYTATLLAETGLKAVWGFIMGLPGETREDLLKTLRIMEKLRRLSSNNYFIGPQIFRPYPGSKLYQKALQYGLREPKNLREWSRLEFTPEGWFGSESLPWIPEENRALVKYINVLAPVYFNRNYLRTQFPGTLFHKFLRVLFALRLAYNIWIFPHEYRLRNVAARFLPR